ncbi:MAG: right-handed parallel beta-helix repeat-containing protein [Lentisphaeria bacterium]|nr:right-handed parallel beta-helix repeat-containing protein [Lentisphaeria bacterium]
MKHVFEILQHGACPDGATLNTSAIQGAIDACHKAGGGQVVCGSGTWLTGALELKSHVELHLARGCRLVGSPRLEDYAPLVAEGFHTEISPEKSACSLIWAVDAEHIAITGAGTIDGSGLAFYDVGEATGKLDKPDTPRPRIGMFYRCRALCIQDVTFVDCSCWTLWLMQCENVYIHRIEITGNARMRNVDGIDLDSCRDVTVSDCRMDTEDDCVAIRAMQRLYDSPAVCENITVTNCVLKSRCQGVRVGCPGDGVIRNCVFSNLVIQSENNGILFENPHRYLRETHSGSAHITNILFSNIVVNCRRSPIKVLVEDGIALSRLGDLSFSDFRIRSGGPCVVQGSPETVIRNVKFSNMKIETSGEDAILCRHCEGVQLTNVELSNGVGIL